MEVLDSINAIKFFKTPEVLHRHEVDLSSVSTNAMKKVFFLVIALVTLLDVRFAFLLYLVMAYRVDSTHFKHQVYTGFVAFELKKLKDKYSKTNKQDYYNLKG